MSATSKIGLKLERMAYELRLSGNVLKAEGNATAQAELDAITALMAALGERLNPSTPA